MTAVTTSSSNVRDSTSGNQTTSSWLSRIDAWSERFGDACNPILVKETRQALKSRQFVVTFSALLFAALAWTIVGSLSMMPQIYTSPSAPRMLIGYYLVLAIPMLMVVPLAAYRSLEGEIDDGTLELLSITTLSPWQIVLGKLASAMLQMMLYFVALFPCVAYAYTLRGVDLPTTLMIMGLLLVAGISLTIVALFFARLARSRTGRIVTLLAVVLILFSAEWGLAALVITWVLQAQTPRPESLFFGVTAVVLLAASVGHLLLAATAAQLTPESENRSTRLRVSLLVCTAVTVGLSVLALLMPGDSTTDIFYAFGTFLAILWALAGAMLAAESSSLTPRIRRELPQSLLARVVLTWLTPGPSTGLVFAVINIGSLAVIYGVGLRELVARQGVGFWPLRSSVFAELCFTYAAYLIGMLIMVRWLVAAIRVRNNPRVEFGIAALIVVAVFCVLIPYSIGLHLNDYRSYSYSMWQITNWAWTLFGLVQGADRTLEMMVIGGTVSIAFLVNLLTMPSVLVPRRTATPDRVAREQKRLAEAASAASDRETKGV